MKLHNADPAGTALAAVPAGLARLLEVVRTLSFALSSTEVMTILKGAARELSGADGVSVVLRDGDLCHYVDEDAIAPLWKGQRFPMAQCISGWCMLERREARIEDIYADARIPQDAYRPTFVRSLAMVPIRADDPIGALGAYWARPHRPSDAEVAALHELAGAAALALRNVQLIEALEERERRRQRYLAQLAHELRNPMASIANGISLLRLGADDVQARGVHEMMERQMRRLAGYLDELLDAARIEQGKLALRRERLDLGALLRACAEDARGGFDAAGVALALDLPAVALPVSGDAARLGQALGCLLDNARKFTPRGGHARIEARVDEAAGEACVAVADDGPGVPRHLLESIFEPFLQGGDPGAIAGGLGLGLAIARGIVELHGGAIRAEPAPAGGLCVQLRIPLTR